jgi:formylglycine-generating enzyme required for sulfatase activity
MSFHPCAWPHPWIKSIAAIWCALAFAQGIPLWADPDFDVARGAETIDAPPASMTHADWLDRLQKWRDSTKAGLSYNGAVYDRPELRWTQRSFIQPQMMVEDRYFYDPVARRYTVDRYLDDLTARYGPIDSVLVWPVYPNVGIDNRSQHDLLRALPGGYAGVSSMIADFHRRGVHVLFPMMPWEKGTREEGLPLKDAVAKNFKEAGIDGVNGDTMNGVGQDFMAAADAVGHPLAFEPEGGTRNLADLQYDTLSWGYWPRSHAPPVDRLKWLEPRHLTNVCERWASNHTDGLQVAFFNGDGFESWENIWGIWNGLTPRDAETIRRVGLVERGVADFLTSSDWEPMTPTLQPDVYASRFPLKDQTVWLFVNRSGKALDGPQLSVPFTLGTRYYDVWNGHELNAQVSGNSATLSFPVEPNGFGAVIALSSEPGPELQKLMATMSTLSQSKLADLSHAWTPLPQHIVEINATSPATTAPEGMVPIPAATYHFKVHGVEIEGWGPIPAADKPGVDVQLPGEPVSRLVHEMDVPIKAFYIDKFPVTNEQFKAFLDATHYRPEDDFNFLKDWTNGDFPNGWAKKPVTWVALEDARAYALWAGKRLPHEWEWQYAAQGSDGRLYPWGNAPDATRLPPPGSGHDLHPPTDVDTFPAGASPFGVMDLVGNVWQWTDEYQDDHTRAAIVRGGSYYRPAGSMWYFPANTTLDQHGKYLLMCPGKDRAGTLGFRCIKDAP